MLFVRLMIDSGDAAPIYATAELGLDGKRKQTVGPLRQSSKAGRIKALAYLRRR